jgi:hypothetical protein
MFGIRPLVGPLRAALSARLAVLLTLIVSMYVAARVCALDQARGEPNPLVQSEDVQPLHRAHAHNDFQHRRPLLDALARGFSSVEADVWFSHGKLLVAHYYWQTDPARTLASLYLEPLRKRVESNRGVVYRGSPESVQLLIDVKTDSEESYGAIQSELAHYANMLTTFEGGEVHAGAVTVVISGNCPRSIIASQRQRFAGCDGRIEDLARASSASVLPLISEDWGSVFDWQGDGPMPTAQRSKLLRFTRTAHARGQKIRFWSTPDASGSKSQASVWSELVAAGVDYINTDSLDTLRGFLTRYDRSAVKSPVSTRGFSPLVSVR